MKSLKEVAKKLEPQFQNIIDTYLYDGEVYEGIITYSAFEHAMMENGWILSDKTVQQKWKLLRANGVFVDLPYRTDRAKFNVVAYCKVVGYTPYVEVKNKKTIFSDSPETEEVRA